MSNGMEIVLPSVRQHEAVLVPRLSELDKWSGGGEAGGEALIRYTMAELSVNDDLRSCTPTSLYLALLSCAVTGLVPGKLKGYSFLVPFGNTRKGPDGKTDVKVQEATFMMGWKGVKHIGYRAGLQLMSAVIHENDVFDYDVGTTKFVKYRPAFKASGVELGAVAWVELPRGGLEVEYLTMATLASIKAAATRLRKSPAWDGPFADQMHRKSALKRLGKQIEMGEEFLKADAIELAQDEHGSAARALDELTDGAASKMLGSQSAEAAAFGHLPRPTQVQVPANDAAKAAAPATPAADATKLAAATDKARAADKKRDRPTTPATPSTNSSASAAGSPSTSTASTPSGTPSTQKPAAVSGGAASPTSPTPATSTAGSASPPASAATPAASSPASSPAEPPPSTASESSSTSTDGSGADGGDFGSPEPTEQDSSFDTAFFDKDESDDPVDRQPKDHVEWLAAFRAWSEAHTTRDSAIADWSQFRELFEGWLAACVSKDQMEAEKRVWTDWSKPIFTTGRKADPSKKLEAVPPDAQIVEMQDGFSKRHKDVP